MREMDDVEKLLDEAVTEAKAMEAVADEKRRAEDRSPQEVALRVKALEQMAARAAKVEEQQWQERETSRRRQEDEERKAIRWEVKVQSNARKEKERHRQEGEERQEVGCCPCHATCSPDLNTHAVIRASPRRVACRCTAGTGV